MFLFFPPSEATLHSLALVFFGSLVPFISSRTAKPPKKTTAAQAFGLPGGRRTPGKEKITRDPPRTHAEVLSDLALAHELQLSVEEAEKEAAQLGQEHLEEPSEVGRRSQLVGSALGVGGQRSVGRKFAGAWMDLEGGEGGGEGRSFGRRSVGSWRLEVGRSAVGGWRSALGGRRSEVGGRRSRSEFGGGRSICGASMELKWGGGGGGRGDRKLRIGRRSESRFVARIGGEMGGKGGGRKVDLAGANRWKIGVGGEIGGSG